MNYDLVFFLMMSMQVRMRMLVIMEGFMIMGMPMFMIVPMAGVSNEKALFIHHAHLPVCLIFLS